MTERARSFTAPALGLRASLPLIIGYLPAAAAFGVAAKQSGLDTAETMLCSLVIYAGASQFALIGLLAAGAPLLLTVLTSLFLNLRHVLYGPSIARYLQRLSLKRALPIAFGLTDEVFAVSSSRMPREHLGAGWLLGIELGAYLSWLAGTWIGTVAGSRIIEAVPSLAGALGFALPALFVALIVPALRGGTGGKTYEIPAAVLASAILMVVLRLSGAGSWIIVLAGVIGPIVGEIAGRASGSRSHNAR